MPYVQFFAAYDYTWSSRAVTAFPAGWSGSVKREVARAAVAAGRAELLTPPPEGADTVAVDGESQ